MLMGLRTHADPIPAGERAFLLASTRLSLEEGDTPVKVRNFAKQKKGGAQ
ncbi:MAG: hypothetical protein HFF00_04680 [Ruminiclostridium sp.]|nr:hypothetical protein [Ruminiclostridium sp.]